MRETKTVQWRRLCSENPGMSPFVLLKISMVWHGARLSAAALARLQEGDYRFASAEPFDIAFGGRPARLVMPGGVLLRDATYVYINWGETYDDPYVIDFDERTGEFVLREPAAGPIAADGDPAGDAREGVVDVVDFVPRPELFDHEAAGGVPMDELADVRAQKLILTSYRRCEFWGRGEQCRFCALFTRHGIDPEVPCAQLGETVRAALTEPGRYSELYISGGTDYAGEPPFGRELERYLRCVRAMGEAFSGRFSCQVMAPAWPRELVKHLHDESGVTSYSPNLEVWGVDQFARLCPGKNAHVGYDEWLRRTVEAVDVFGAGNVYTQVVGGAELAGDGAVPTPEEAIERNLEACEWFAERGVTCLSVIWRPHRRSVLGWRPMPPIEYYVELAKGFHDVRASHGLVAFEDDYKMCGNHPDADLERIDVSVWKGLNREVASPEVAAAGETPSGEGAPRVSVPGEEGTLFCEAFSASELGVSKLAGERGVVVALREDRSDLGAGLTRALWFDEPVELWLREGIAWRHVRARVWRCDVVGPVFSAALARVREGSPSAEVASAWELRVVEEAPVVSAPAARVPSRAPRPELHLDNPLLH